MQGVNPSRTKHWGACKKCKNRQALENLNGDGLCWSCLKKNPLAGNPIYTAIRRKHEDQADMKRLMEQIDNE